MRVCESVEMIGRKRKVWRRAMRGELIGKAKTSAGPKEFQKGRMEARARKISYLAEKSTVFYRLVLG
jgi:hypothetical protein